MDIKQKSNSWTVWAVALVALVIGAAGYAIWDDANSDEVSIRFGDGEFSIEEQ